MSKWIRNEHTTEYHDLTPELARELLALSRGNRGIRPIIAEYKRDMRDSRYLVWDGPSISKTGRLLNWHHRLQAAYESGVTIPRVPIIMGVPDEALQYFDDKRAKRTNAQQLQFEGERNTQALAAALRVVSAYLDGSFASGYSRSINDPVEKLAEHPDIRRSVTLCRSLVHSEYTHTADFQGLHYLFSKVNRAEADAFVEAVSKGVGLAANDPAWVLRERLRKVKEDKKNRMSEAYRVALIIKPWEKWVSGQSASKDHMRWRTDGSEYFPRITGIPVNW